MIKSIYNRYFKLVNVEKREFGLSWEQEKEYMDSLGQPKDDIDRSYFQYRCQRKLMGEIKRFFLDIASFVLIMPSVFFLLFVNFALPKKEKREGVVTLTKLARKEMLPDDLKVLESLACLERECVRLTANDLHYIYQIARRHPFAFFFLIKCIWMIAAYSYAIYKYEPKAIIASSEYSFTSSILTAYCEKHGIRHYDVMHGEKILNIRDSFFRFSKMYVWDIHYVNLFKKLNAMKADSDYIVYGQMNTKINTKQAGNIVKYYLQIQTKEQLQIIKESLEKLGREYKVRPHPLYKNKWIYSVFDDAHIEEPIDVPIETSLNEAALAVAEDSTVLQQAYLLGIPIVIDDITNHSYFCELNNRNYIMLQKEHTLLSKMLQRK